MSKEQKNEKNQTNVSTSKNYSQIAIEWLEYVAKSEGIIIKHALNGGEVVIEDPELVTEKTKKPKKYFADGFCEATNTVYEYLGDFTHGNIHVNASEFFQKKYNKTKERENRIKELGYNVVVMWHADWLAIRQTLYENSVVMMSYYE